MKVINMELGKPISDQNLIKLNVWDSVWRSVRNSVITPLINEMN